MTNVTCFLFAVLLYAISTLGYIARWIGGSRWGERLARPGLLGAVVLHGVAILLRWAEAGHAPLSNGFEAFSLYGWGLSLVYLLVKPLRRYDVLGVFVTPLALVSILVALVLPKRIQPLVPMLQGYWVPVHVGISFAAYTMFSLAFIVAVAYLLQEQTLSQPGRRTWARQLPSLEALENLGHWLAVIGLWLMTGSLLSGSLWAEKAWGVIWVWEPQQIAALTTWLIYAVYFHLRHHAGWRDRRAAWLLVSGFASVLITFVGADLLMPGSHHSFLFGS
ncbi:MAG TPA: c-type cytochrome biogenesis protein CcsB [Anaerolineae bacterium]|nr:c-type cytochrome biogenesis protein CcsB [Anaerolineae bacterium]HIQ04564.1 c-type cytochrome biogenesis protein CcsB [Anaerolineae bacterium]